MSASLAVSTLVVCNFLAGVGLLTKRLKKRLVLSIDMLRDLKSRGKFYKIRLSGWTTYFHYFHICSAGPLQRGSFEGPTCSWKQTGLGRSTLLCRMSYNPENQRTLPLISKVSELSGWPTLTKVTALLFLRCTRDYLACSLLLTVKATTLNASEQKWESLAASVGSQFSRHLSQCRGETIFGTFK